MKSLIELRKTLKQKVLGQDKSIDKFCTIYYKYLIKKYAPDFACEFNSSTICLFIGNSGVGKTYLVREAAKIFNIPIIELNSKAICQEGWSGKSFLNLIEEECIKLNSSIQKIDFNRIIIFIDEFDKFVTPIYSSGSENISRTLQSTILKYVEGMNVNFKELKIQVNTKEWMFVFAGAFQDLKIKKNQSIGFNQSKQSEEILLKDLENYGMLPELLGRIQEIIEFDEVTRKTYTKILNSEFFVLNQWIELLRRLDIKFLVPKEDLIDKAIQSDLGIRGLIQEVEYLITQQILKNAELIDLNKFSRTESLKEERKSILDLKKAQLIENLIIESRKVLEKLSITRLEELDINPVVDDNYDN